MFVYTASGFDSTPVEHVEYSYNEYSELAEQISKVGSADRVLYQSTWQNGEKVSETDQFGITTTYTYNALQQIETSTKQGVGASGNHLAQPAIVTDHGYDTVTAGCGCCTGSDRSITADGVTLETITKKDKAGRLLNQTDADGFITSYAYTEGGRITTKVLPSGATEVTERFLDGQVKSITGTGVVPQYFYYSVGSAGERHTFRCIGHDRIIIDEENYTNPEQWEETTTNMLGQTIKIEKPGFDTANHIVEMVYNAEGRLTKRTQPGQADSLFIYDDAGNLFRSGLDLTNSGTLSLTADRVTETKSEFAKIGSDWHRQSIQRVYASETSSNYTEVSTQHQQLTGLPAGVISKSVSIDARNNETIHQVEVDRSGALVTETTTVPGSNIDAVRVTRNGLLQQENGTEFAEPTKYQYDAFGRRVATIDPRIGATTVTYRTFNGDLSTGRLIASSKNPATNKTEFAYHTSGAGTGQLKSRKDPDGKMTYFDYNLRGQQIRTWGATYPVAYGYDPDYGRLTHQYTYRAGIDWFGANWPSNTGDPDTTTWHYQEKTGLLVAKEYPKDEFAASGEKTQYTYTTAGQLATRTWARLQVNEQDLVTTYTYWEDAGGELKKVEYSDGTPSVEYTYTRIGQVDTVIDAVGARTFGYTAFLELETEEIDAGVGGLYSFLLTHKYQGTGTGELKGRPAGVSVGTVSTPAANYDSTWHYDSAGRFAAVEGPGLPEYGAVYEYLTASRRVESVSYMSDATTVTASSTYTPLSDRNLVETVANMAGTTTISTYEYGYDAFGQRTSVENSGSAFGVVEHNKFDYNDRREVVESKRFDGSVATPISEISAQSREYIFDTIGNRISQTDGNGTAVNYTPNELNQYDDVDSVAFIYDEDGNLLEDGENTYEWDGENRLETFSGATATATFTYDYMGRRVRALFNEGTENEKEERYVWDDWNLLLVLNENNTPIRKFTWGLDIAEQASGLPRGGRPGSAAGGVGGLLAVDEISGSNSGEYVYFYDANGNVGQVLNWSTDTVAAHYEYDPFGRTIASEGDYAETNRFRFSTKTQDQVTDLYYYGYRYYSPSMGRFLNRDPIEEQGGLNLYGFVNNDPVNAWDYLGLSELTFFYMTQIETATVTFPNIPFLRRTFNGGLKTAQTVSVDVNECEITWESNYVGLTIEYDSSGGIKGTGRSSGDTITASANMRFDDCVCVVTMSGNEANPLVMGSPGISYDVLISIFPSVREYAWWVEHDGFPSHEFRGHSGTALYSFSHVSAGTSPLRLFPPMNQSAYGYETY